MERENENEVKLSFKTKHSRRAKKYSNVLSREYQAVCTNHPTSTVAICNSGLATGLSREQLLQLALPFGRVKDVILVPGKSSSFIDFCSEEVASRAYHGLHGKPAPHIKQGELFLAFVEKAPRVEAAWGEELPEGLRLVPNFVSCEEEQGLMDCIDWTTSDPQAGQALKHRRVRHYGYQFDYGTNNVDPESPLDDGIPQACDVVLNRLSSAGLVPWRPDQMTVNQYQPGQGIPPHVDTHSAFEDPILSLSLGAAVVMEFRRGSRMVPVLLPRRSLLVMAGEARYCWSHGITPRKSDIVPCVEGGMTLQLREVRTSLTLRRLRRAPCACSHPQHCDSQQAQLDTGLEQSAAQLENLHVHQVYEEIACHFSETRHKPWPNVLSFVQSQPAGSVLLDVGCGNGKYLGLNSCAFQVGCDSSVQLAKVCRERRHEAFTCNCLHLPVRDSSVDCCLSIAVIHHLSTQERRERAVQEMCRVLRVGGQALVYVWARDQERGRVKSSYLRQARKQPEPEPAPPPSPFSLPVHTNRTQFAHPDMLVPWKLRPTQGQGGEESSEVFYRYYHVFDEGELEELCGHVAGLRLVRGYYDQGNWCVIVQKTGC